MKILRSLKWVSFAFFFMLSLGALAWANPPLVVQDGAYRDVKYRIEHHFQMDRNILNIDVKLTFRYFPSHSSENAPLLEFDLDTYRNQMKTFQINGWDIDRKNSSEIRLKKFQLKENTENILRATYWVRLPDHVNEPSQDLKIFYDPQNFQSKYTFLGEVQASGRRNWIPILPAHGKSTFEIVARVPASWTFASLSPFETSVEVRKADFIGGPSKPLFPGIRSWRFAPVSLSSSNSIRCIAGFFQKQKDSLVWATPSVNDLPENPERWNELGLTVVTLPPENSSVEFRTFVLPQGAFSVL